MSLIRRGITGFDTEIEVDFDAFKKAVYAVAQFAGATVIGTSAADGVTPNFHEASIRLGDNEVGVICNRTFPIIAFVERPIAMTGIQPLDLPELATAFRNFGFEVATAAELQRPLATEDLKSLSENERNQAEYWKPKRVSQVVFNWWD